MSNKELFAYRIDNGSENPIYEQLVRFISDDVVSGKLPYGTKLPTVREMSDNCGIAVGTVMRAYDELEQEGIIEKIQGRGSFVCHRDDPFSRKNAAVSAIDGMLDTLQELNFSMNEISIFLNLKMRERDSDRDVLKVAVFDAEYDETVQVGNIIHSIGEADVFSCSSPDEIREKEPDIILCLENQMNRLKSEIGESVPIGTISRKYIIDNESLNYIREKL